MATEIKGAKAQSSQGSEQDNSWGASRPVDRQMMAGGGQLPQGSTLQAGQDAAAKKRPTFSLRSIASM